MSTYPYLGDRQLEPDDDSIERDAAERAGCAAFDEYLADGWLPDGRDPSVVDERMLEALTVEPGIESGLDALITAKTDEELLALAKRIRDTRISIIEQIIDESWDRAA